MLGELEATYLSTRLFRFSNPRDVLAAINALAFQGTEASEILEFLGEAGKPSNLDDLLLEPFKRKPQLEGLFGRATRYSDGTWPVYYSALETETAEQEVWHWYVRDTAGPGRSAFYRLLEASFSGSVKDIRVLQTTCPELVGGDYSPCIAVAQQALSENLDALLAPSARRTGGTTVPVFSQPSLSNPRLMAHIAFTVDPGTGEQQIVRR